MKKLIAIGVFCISCVAVAAGFDGLALMTNDWFDASFTSLTASSTAISAGDTTGITLGAGSWSAVPSEGEAIIATDEDDATATVLSIDATDEKLTFTPAALSSVTGYETSALEIKTVAVDELPEMESDVQASFALYDNGSAVAAMAYVSGGWTNLVYDADTLTNSWFTLYIDFANVDSTRYVRYSVKPSSGSLAVLADSEGTTWFQAAYNATTINSLTFSGCGSCRSLGGDSLEQAAAAYNGTSYATVALAIAAAQADSWASGNVTLLANATWVPAASGTYYIDAGEYTLTVDGAVYTVSDTTYTVTGFKYYWIGGTSDSWDSGDNWSRTEGGEAANAYPNSYAVDEAYVISAAAITLPSSSNANVSNLFVNANVSFSGGKIHAKAISGSGKLTMLDGTSFYASEYCSTVSVDVEVPSDATVCVSNNGSSKGYGYGVMFTEDCALTGSGTIRFDSYRSSNPLYWDASGFSGTIVIVKDSQSRNSTSIRATSATHAGMSWQIDNSDAGNFIAQSGEYELGSLSGNVYIVGGSSSSAYAFVKNVTMVIGGLNADDELGGQISRNAGRTTDGAYIRKVGTGVLSSSVKGVNGYYIKEGVLNIASNYGLSARNANGDPGTGLVFEGGTLRIADGVTSDVSAYIACGAGSTSPVIFDDEGRDHTWATALGSTLTGGLVKKGEGTLTLSATPAYSGATVIEEGVLVVPQGTTIEELSLGDDAGLQVPLTGTEDETAILTITALAEGTTQEDLEAAVAIGGATITVESGDSGYIVKATRTQQTFIWNGAVDTDWATPDNWTVGESAAVSLPLERDIVVFPESEDGWVVTLASDAVASNIVFNANTVITGGSYKITVREVSGSGTLTAKGLKLLAPAESHLTISNPLDIPEDYVFETAVSTQYKHVYLYSKVTGAGTWNMNQNSTNQRGAVQFRGDQGADMSEFAGSLTVINKGSSTRDQTAIYGSIASSSNAIWTVYGFAKEGDASSSFVKNSGTTYYFGALNGYACASGDQSNFNKNTWEIGAREDVDSVLSGNFFCNSYPNLVGDRSDTIRKVGAGSTLTFSGSRVRAYEVNAGVLKIGSESALLTTWDGGSYAPSIAFNGGTLKVDSAVTLDVSTNIAAVTSSSAIIFDDEGVDRKWEVSIPGTGGLVKKGEGTLTLSAAPLYSGATYLEAGTLKIPASAGVKVKSGVAGMKVKKATETIDEVEYTVYTLGLSDGFMMLIH